MKQRGNIVLAVLIVMALLGLSLGWIISNGSNASLGYRVIVALRKNNVTEAWHNSVLVDALALLDSNGVFAHQGSEWFTRQARFNNVIGTTYRIASFAVQPVTGTLFGKAAPLTTAGAYKFWHPLAARDGVDHIQTVSGTLEVDSYLGTVDVSSELTIREVPSSEFGLVVTETYLAGSSPVRLLVNGTTILSRGFDYGAAAAPNRLDTTVLVSPSGQVGRQILAQESLISPAYGMGWGATPGTYVAPSNLVGIIASQSYFDNASWVVTVHNGNLYNPPSAGVVFRQFPAGSGPSRLVIDLNALPASASRLYVNLVSAADKLSGVVVIGDNGAPVGANKSVATNGAVWLWGRNTQPASIASNYGQLYCTDSTWTEATGSAQQLNQTWRGQLYFPNTTAYSTSQTGASSVLNVTGSLVSGFPQGNVATISITEESGTVLKSWSPRILFCIGVK